MQDRVSLYPGRVKLEPVAGQANLYDLTRADQPTQEGTPLNKANLLSDATAAAIKALLASQTEDPATLNEALNILAQAVEDVTTVAAGKCSIANSTYTGNGKYGSANPVTLTFPQKPRLIIIFGASALTLIHDDSTEGDSPIITHSIYEDTAMWHANNVSWSGATLSFYNTVNATFQANISGEIYHVTAFYAQD